MKNKNEFLDHLYDCDDNNAQHLEMIEEYVKANPTIFTSSGFMGALKDIVGEGKINTYNKLFELGMELPQAPLNQLINLARLAAKSGNIGIFLKILGDKAEVLINATIRAGETFLNAAASEKNIPLSFVKELISLGADVNNSDRIGQTPLTHAVSNVNYDLIDLLLNEGSNLLAKTGEEEQTLLADLVYDSGFLTYLNHATSKIGDGHLSLLGRLRLLEGLNYTQSKENSQELFYHDPRIWVDCPQAEYNTRFDKFKFNTKDIVKQLISNLIESDFQELLDSNQYNLVGGILNQSKIWVGNNPSDEDCRALVEFMKPKIEKFLSTEREEFRKNIKIHIKKYFHDKDLAKNKNLADSSEADNDSSKTVSEVIDNADDAEYPIFSLPNEIFAKIFSDVLLSNSLLNNEGANEIPLLCASQKLEGLASLNDFIENFEVVKTEVTGETPEHS